MEKREPPRPVYKITEYAFNSCRFSASAGVERNILKDASKILKQFKNYKAFHDR